jgi:hypothetical protein
MNWSHFEAFIIPFSMILVGGIGAVWLVCVLFNRSQSR